MVLRHGFKAEANRWSRDLRLELDLSPESPMCIWDLCEYLNIPVIELSYFSNLEPKAVAYLSSECGKKEFSAVTFLVDGHRHIIHNHVHDIRRQASNLAHEVAHVLLMHPVATILDKNGKRNLNKAHEEEANWLGPALLISDEAALFIAKQRMTIEEASDYYGASKEVVQMRLNVSGARRRVA